MWSGLWMPRWVRSSNGLAASRREGCWSGWPQHNWRGRTIWSGWITWACLEEMDLRGGSALWLFADFVAHRHVPCGTGNLLARASCLVQPREEHLLHDEQGGGGNRNGHQCADDSVDHSTK
jgi:hypothetical protein